jgi:hypothetical protein
MTRARWFVSLLLACHLLAVLTAAIPSPADMAFAASQPTSALATGGKSSLDALATMVQRATTALYAVVAPIQIIARPYVRAGLYQRWNMFSALSTDDHYVRLDYEVQEGTDYQVYRQLILPSSREDRPRWVHNYRDKAVINALNAYLRERADAPRQPSRQLDPLARYLTTRYRDQHGIAGRILRTSVWYGVAPGAGKTSEVGGEPGRAAVLEHYYGNSAVPVAPAMRPVYREGDITWSRLTAVADPMSTLESR